MSLNKYNKDFILDLYSKLCVITNTLYFQGYIKDPTAEIQDTLQKIRVLLEELIEENFDNHIPHID